jgi:hypothetical protein
VKQYCHVIVMIAACLLFFVTLYRSLIAKAPPARARRVNSTCSQQLEPLPAPPTIDIVEARDIGCAGVRRRTVMMRCAWLIVGTLALGTAAPADAAPKGRHAPYIYVRDFNFSTLPSNVIEGRFSSTLDRACKIVDPNKKIPAPKAVLVARFRCPGGEGVNQFLVDALTLRASFIVSQG